MTGWSLAQAGSQSTQNVVHALVWVGVLIALVVILGLVVVVIRRRLLSNQAPGPAGLTLMETLRDARDRGEMTQEEYETVRKRLAERLSREPPPTRRPPTDV